LYGNRLSLDDRGLEQVDLAGIGVQPSPNAERNSPLGIYMAEGKTIGDRDAQRTEVVAEHVIKTQSTVLPVSLELGELPDHDTCKFLQSTYSAELGKNPIDPVEVLADVLKKQERARQFGEPRRADQTLKQSQIAASKRALGNSTGNGDYPVFLR
jgi:hypothetical protein